MTRRFPIRVRLWMKLAIFAALGVSLTHAVHLVLGNRISSRALARNLEAHGRSVARIIAHAAADEILVSDRVSLHETVVGAAAAEDVAYCFVVRDGQVLASSFAATTPPALVGLRDRGLPAGEAVVVRGGDATWLDVAEPILGGHGGTVRIGMKMDVLRSTRRELGILLGLVAAGVILAGIAAALLVGRQVAGPVGELVAAADRFDPAQEVSPVRSRGSDEIADLTVRFNQMMARLKAAHDQAERARQKDQETERLVALGSLVAGVAHEVNNPLAGLMNCHRRLLRDDLPDAKRREYLDLMKEALERIEDVVRRLLDFGRPRPLVLARVALAELAESGGRLLRPLLAKRGIALKEELADVPDAHVYADRRQIGQALMNLLLNAAYVTPDRGEIRIRGRRRDGLCGLAVEDDGPGIPEGIRERIFDPFFSTKPEGEGTGLGLPVTRSIVAAHGGELAFEFPDGRGTTVTVWLRSAS